MKEETIKRISLLFGYLVGLAIGTFLVSRDENVVVSFVIHIVVFPLVYIGTGFLVDKLGRR